MFKFFKNYRDRSTSGWRWKSLDPKGWDCSMLSIINQMLFSISRGIRSWRKCISRDGDKYGSPFWSHSPVWGADHELNVFKCLLYASGYVRFTNSLSFTLTITLRSGKLKMWRAQVTHMKSHSLKAIECLSNLVVPGPWAFLYWILFLKGKIEKGC